MNFHNATNAILIGCKVRRKSWRYVDYVYLFNGLVYFVSGGDNPKMYILNKEDIEAIDWSVLN